MDGYSIAVVVLYSLICVSNAGFAIYPIYQFFKLLKGKKFTFLNYVYLMTALYCTVKTTGMVLQVVNISIGRSVPALRGLTASVDNFAMQMFFTLLDTVVVSWARINANLGKDSEQATFKIITIVVIVKYAFVYLIIVGYLIVFLGAWHPALSLAFTLAFSASVLTSAITFLALFIFMSVKTTSLTNTQSQFESVKVCYKKLLTTSIIVSVAIAILCLLLFSSHLIFILNYSEVAPISVAGPIIDTALILQSIVPFPVLFWLMFVTYTNSSIIVKYLGQAGPKQEITEQKAESTEETKA